MTRFQWTLIVILVFAVCAFDVTSAGCIAGGHPDLPMSPKLWLSNRTFPPPPAAELDKYCPALKGLDRVCCSPGQFQFMTVISFLQLQHTISGCGACNYALQALFCQMACLPEQEKWYLPTIVNKTSGRLYQFSLNVSQDYADRMWESCSGLGAMGPQKINDFGNVKTFLSVFAVQSPPTDDGKYHLQKSITAIPANETGLNPPTINQNPMYQQCIRQRKPVPPHYSMPKAEVGGISLQYIGAAVYTVILVTTAATHLIHRCLHTDKLEGSPMLDDTVSSAFDVGSHPEKKAALVVPDRRVAGSYGAV